MQVPEDMFFSLNGRDGFTIFSIFEKKFKMIQCGPCSEMHKVK